MKPFLRRKALETIFTHKKWRQFGQNHDATTSNGSEACTHVVLQCLIYLWTGKDVTIDEISRIAGYRPSDEGMNSGHVDRVIAHFDLPYVASFRMDGGPPSTNEVIAIVREKGPALVGVPYGLYPLDDELVLHNEAIRGGRNDLGFAGNHAVCVFAARWLRKRGVYRMRGMDPDHGSPARPDIPAFDIYTDRQFARMWEHNLVGKSYGRFGYFPTREWTGIPGAKP